MSERPSAMGPSPSGAGWVLTADGGRNVGPVDTDLHGIEQTGSALGQALGRGGEELVQFRSAVAGVQLGAGPVHDHGRQAGRGGVVQPVDELERLGHRDLLGEGDVDDAGANRIAEQFDHPARLVGDPPDRGDLGHVAGRRKFAQEVAARGGVDNDEVPIARTGLVGVLADQQQLSHPWGRIRHERERARHGARHGTQWAQLQLDEFSQRRPGVDLEYVQVRANLERVGRGGRPEQAGRTRAAIGGNDQRAGAPKRGELSDGGRDR